MEVYSWENHLYNMCAGKITICVRFLPICVSEISMFALKSQCCGNKKTMKFHDISMFACEITSCVG